jgi:hypothetical protein
MRNFKKSNIVSKKAFSFYLVYITLREVNSEVPGMRKTQDSNPGIETYNRWSKISGFRYLPTLSLNSLRQYR